MTQTVYDKFVAEIKSDFAILSKDSQSPIISMLNAMAEDAYNRGVQTGKIFETVTPDEAVAKGFAEFNTQPHLCVDVPDGGYTITTRTSEGRRATFSFAPYKTGGAPQCIDIDHNNSGLPTVPGRDDLNTFDTVGFSAGGDTFDTRKIERRTNLISVLLGNQRKKESE